MGRELTPAELNELLPLYALGALDADELEQVEQYVRRNTSARDEVESLLEAASLLPNPHASAPASLWTRIEDTLAQPPPNTFVAPTPAPSSPRQLPSRGSRPRRVLLTAAALVACIAIGISVFLGVKLSDQQSRIDQLAALMHHDTMANQAETAKAVRGAHLVMLTSADPTHTAQVVMLPDGTGYLMHPELPTLEAGHTYQLWAKTGTHDAPAMISAGVLGRAPSVTAFRVAAPVLGFEVTEEAATGAQAPTSTPVLTADIA
jgi:anti-sigma-K factor RskA